MVREAERMGIMVWSEIPVYWTIAWKNEDTYKNAERQLTDMIARDKNRANVIIWSIANETPHSAERDLFLSRLAQYARTQDTTRLISMAMEVTGASNYVNRLQDNMHQYVDIVSFNQYIGWYRYFKLFPIHIKFIHVFLFFQTMLYCPIFSIVIMLNFSIVRM